MEISAIVKNNPIISLVILVIFAVAVIFSVYYAVDIFGIGGDEAGVFIDVPKGATLDEISSALKENGLVNNENVFYIYAKNKYVNFCAGGHVFNTAMSYKEICESLSESPRAEYVKVLIPEGYELRMIGDAVEKAGLVTAEEFIEAAENDSFDYDFLPDKREGTTYRLEGFLFPATYEFEYGISAHDIIDKMLSAFDRIYTDKLSSKASELGMSAYDVVTFASVVEREAGNVAEHKRVAGVFQNRIDDNMKLESCATVQYILKERKAVLSNRDIKIDSPYNTYMYEGLPVGPIASPSLSAIEAVLYPEEHNYYYFVAKSDGSGNVFSKTFAEHQRAISENQ